MRRPAVFLAYIALFFRTSLAAQTLLSNENAYNPVPSPDGKKIAAVRTGWHRHGGSGGLGRSNLVSEVIVLDRTGRLLSPKPIGDGFVSDWKQDGIIVFRDWAYSLVKDDGTLRQRGRVCPEMYDMPPDPPDRGCVERVAYLSSLRAFVWVRQEFGDSVLLTYRGELSPHHHENVLGECLVPSPDESYIAVAPGTFGLTLNIYDLRQKAWNDLGKAIIHPDKAWDWMKASWSPWFADSSQLAFFTSDGLVVSSPNGNRRVLLAAREPAGLATPSPDGRAIAYGTFASHPGPNGGSIWHSTGIWVVDLKESSQPRQLTGATQGVTHAVRWLDDQNLVFDSVEGGIPPKGRLWTVHVDR